MFQSPDQEWRRLTTHYAEMWDDELLNLAADYNTLTEMAQQALREEMRKRNLGDPTAPRPAETPPAQPPQPQSAFSSSRQPRFEAPPAPFAPPLQERVRPVGQEQEREWRRCQQHYGALSNQDLENLAEELMFLTPLAQQALRDEMTNRGLDFTEGDLFVEEDDGSAYDADNPLLAAAEMRARNAPPANEWWVQLTEVDDRERAEQFAIMLSDAGIQHRWRSEPSGANIIEVAADQAEEAQRVLAQPVPRSVIDDSKIEPTEFAMPPCPRCRNEEPTLLGTDPANQWHCESCGHEWTDSILEQA